ncbi:DMT family transporter [Cellulomonas sp. KRMCY2]|uniref:DMT family transporter n=1 Tax=Cellulomonas sp. KRMCY2 TaxID=1304865 RepID=UPI00045E5BA5|nr:EamA family transporter [Cellulomonas sp. KRMCY2]
MTRRGWLLLAALGVIWGIPYLLIKVAVAEVSPATVVLARTAIGAAVLLPFALRGAGFAALRGRWPAVLLFAGLEIVGPWLLFSDAEQTIASSTTGLLVATVPVLAVLVGRLVGDRQPVRAVRWAGLLIGLGGVAVLTGPGLTDGHAWAVIEVLLGALGYAIAPVVAERALQGVPASVLTTACLGVAALVYGPVVAFSGPAPTVSPAAVAALATLGLVCTALAFVLFFRLISEVGGPRSTLVAYLNPVVAVTLGAAVLQEPLGLGVAVATLLIVGGSAAASLPTTRVAEPALGAGAPGGRAPVPARSPTFRPRRRPG